MPDSSDGCHSEAPQGSTGVGEYLRNARGAASLSAVADRCGLDKGYLSRVERGERNPKLCHLRILAAGYGVPEATLMRIAQGRPQPAEPAEKLHALVDGLGREDQLTALRVLEALFAPTKGENNGC